MPDDEADTISTSSLNDHYLDAEQEYELDVQGTVAISIPPEMISEGFDDDDLAMLPDILTTSIDRIEDVRVAGDDFSERPWE